MITRTTIRFFVHPSTHEELDCSLVRPRRRLGLDNNIDEQSQWGPSSAACESDACREPTSPSSRSCFDIISLSSVKTKLISGRNQLQHFARLSSSLCAPPFFFFFFCLFGEDAEWNGGLKWFFCFFKWRAASHGETVWRDHRGLIEKQMRARPEDGRTGQEVAAECVCVTNESWGYTQNDSADTHTFDCRRRYHQLQFHRLQSQGQYHRGCPDEKTQSGIVSTKTSIFPNNFKMTIMEFPLA